MINQNNFIFVFQTLVLIAKITPDSILSLFKDIESKKKNHQQIGLKLKRYFENQGGFYIKFGQLLSHRYDLLPQEICDELLPLTENVKPFDVQTVKQILKTEVPNLNPKEFTEKPIGSASIAQVHLGILQNDQKVAIKIQRPDIIPKIKHDLKNLSLFIRLIDFCHILPPLKEIFNEFGEWLLNQEVDFLKEAQNLIQADKFINLETPFKTNIPNKTNVPKVYTEFCTSKVLVMEYIQGKTLNKLTADPSLLEQDRKNIALNCICLFLKQCLLDNSFQGDPHLSNIIFTPLKEIYYIDYGLVGKFSDFQALCLLRMYRGFLFRNINLCWDGLIGLLNLSHGDQLKIKTDFVKLFEKFSSDSDFDLSRTYRAVGTDFLLTLLRLIVKYKITIPKNASLVFKSMATTDAVITAIYPGLTVRQMLPSVLDLSQMFIYKIFITHPATSLILEKSVGLDYKNISDTFAFLKTNGLLQSIGIENILNKLSLLNSGDLLDDPQKLNLRLSQLEALENAWLSTQTNQVF